MSSAAFVAELSIFFGSHSIAVYLNAAVVCTVTSRWAAESALKDKGLLTDCTPADEKMIG